MDLFFGPSSTQLIEAHYCSIKGRDSAENCALSLCLGRFSERLEDKEVSRFNTNYILWK
jgi:hypothetical protein